MAELKNDTLNMKDLSSMYGIAASFIKTDKSLQQTLQQILKQKITDEKRMLAMLQNTSWWKKYTNSYRQYQYVKETNPAEFQANLSKARANVQQKAEDLGLSVDEATINTWAEQYLIGSSRMGADGKVQVFDDKWLSQQMAAALDFSNTKEVEGVKILDLEGDIGATANEIYQSAREYGIDMTMSNDQFQGWLQTSLRGVVDGTVNSADIDKSIRDMAMNNFPAFAEQIKNGFTLRQAATPQLNSIAAELELDVNSLNLRDNVVMQVLNNQDKDGNFKPMNAYDARKAARKDSRWQFTQNAKNEYQSISSKILQDFGFGG